MTIVHVDHVHPVAYRTPSRHYALALVGGVTPVRLRRADPDAFEPVLSLDAGWGDGKKVVFHAHEGRLWNRMEVSESGKDRRPLTPEELVAFLQAGHGTRSTFTHISLQNHVFDTPLVPVNGYAKRPPQVVEDGAAAASRALLDLVDSGIRLVGKEVFFRTAGPLARRKDEKLVGEYQLVALPGWGRSGFFSRPDRVEELWRFEREMEPYRTRKGPDRFPGFVNPVDPALLADTDVDRFVNSLPQVVLHCAERWVREGHRLYDDKVVADLLLEMARWMPAAFVGGVPAERQEEVLVLASRIQGHLREGYDVKMGRGMAERFAYCERIALPRVRERAAVPEADADALGGLGLGGP